MASNRSTSHSMGCIRTSPGQSGKVVDAGKMEDLRRMAKIEPTRAKIKANRKIRMVMRGPAVSEFLSIGSRVAMELFRICRPMDAISE